MELKENIRRIRQMMGLINESTEDACLNKNIPENEKIKEYWQNTNKTEQEKTEEIKNYLNPLFEETKKYYLNYVDGDWFKTKVEEKIKSTVKLPTLDNDANNKRIEEINLEIEKLKPKIDPESKKEYEKLNKELRIRLYQKEKGLSQITEWNDEEKKQIKDFISNIELSILLSCRDNLIAYVTSETYNTINFCIKKIYPSEDKTYSYDTLIHEMKHAITEYMFVRGVDILPENLKGPTVFGIGSGYGNSSHENSSRVQNLRRYLGVDDFVSVENLINLLKQKLVIENKNLSRPKKCKITYINQTMIIDTGFDSRRHYEDPVLKLEFYFGGVYNFDTKFLFNAFSTEKKTEQKYNIHIDLKKLFDYCQELAFNSNNEKNINVT
jgi:hypothetical protein